jgi:hypothetical protein
VSASEPESCARSGSHSGSLAVVCTFKLAYNLNHDWDSDATIPGGPGPAAGRAGADPEIPNSDCNSRSPHSRFGRETGTSGIPDSSSRLRPESGNREPPFPDSAGNGNRGPDWPQIGKSGMPLCVSTACTILGSCQCCVGFLAGDQRFGAQQSHRSFKLDPEWEAEDHVPLLLLLEPHAACEGTGMILAAAAEYIPSPLRLMLGLLGRPRVTRESGILGRLGPGLWTNLGRLPLRVFSIGKYASAFQKKGGNRELESDHPGDSRFFARPGNREGIPVSRFGRETGNPRFPIRPPGTGIGVPIRRAGDFKVPGPGLGRGVFLSWAPGARLTECQVLRLPLPVALGTNFGSPAAPGAGRPAL